MARKEISAVLFAVLMIGLSASAADAIPLPRPRPIAAPALQHKIPSITSAAGTARAESVPAQKAQGTTGFPNPFAALLSKPDPKNALNPEQQAIVQRVNNYLTSTQVLSGNFIQVGPDGSRTKGDFFISKPGKVRFEYEDPNPIELVADGQSVVVRDRKLATQDVYPLSQTPLRFLLSNHVDLTKDTSIIAAYADDVFVTVVAEEKNSIIGTSRLMMMFSAKDMQLKQWTVTDPQGYDTTVAVYNLDANKKLDPNLFKIDYTNYRN